MTLHKHLRRLVLVTIAWLLFWIAGLPDYYQQYTTSFMIVFDLAILPPIWLIVYRSIRTAPGRGRTNALWWSFYISVPLFLYDLLYCGLYLGHGLNFLVRYWYISVYYLLPWVIFPPAGWWVDRQHDRFPLSRP